MKTIKQVILLDIANDLYKVLDVSKYHEGKIKEIRAFLDSEYKKLRKDLLEARRRPKVLEYSKGVVHRMILLILYVVYWPKPEEIEKFKNCVNKETEKELFSYLHKLLENHPEGINNLCVDYEDPDEIYISLINVVECMGMKSIYAHVNKKSMSFIKQSELHHIADVCGILEAWRLEKRKTIIKVNKLLQYEKPKFRAVLHTDHKRKL